MTNQEIFDKVVTHLLTQNKRSTAFSGSCQYRGQNGAMCAVGCLITDEVYDSKFEGWNIRDADIKNALELSGVPVEQSHQYGYGSLFLLLEGLQNIHDTIEPCDWPEELLNQADIHGLSTNALKKFGHGQ